MELDKKLVLRVSIAVAFAITLWRNSVTDMSTASAHSSLITPAGPAFSIWGIIYFFVLGFVVRECYSPTTVLPEKHADALYGLFLLTCLFNVTWLYVFSTAGAMVWSMVIILALWLCLLMMYLIVADYVKPIDLTTSLRTGQQPEYPSTCALDYVFLRLPFTLYFAWTTGALLISICIAISAITGASVPMFFNVLCLSILAVVHFTALVIYQDVAFAAVGIWTLAWLAVRASKDKLKYLTDAKSYGEHAEIEGMASMGVTVMIIVLAILMVHRFFFRKNSTTAGYASISTAEYGAIKK